MTDDRAKPRSSSSADRIARALAAARESLALAAYLALASCGSSDVQPCGRIPDPEGCPVGRGGTCDDAECGALYDCVEGSWNLVERCERVSAAGGVGGGSGDAGVGGCEPIAIDHTGETTGCTPDLQSPDCPAVAAETCAASACLTDCSDFFLCTQDGWIAVAHCDEQGQIIVTR